MILLAQGIVANTIADLKCGPILQLAFGNCAASIPLLLNSGKTSQRNESDMFNYQC